MNGLLNKFNDFKQLNNYIFDYLLEDGTKIIFKISQYNFPHLIGLQKLIDLRIIGQFIDPNNNNVTAKRIVNYIKKEEYLTEDIIKSSLYFSDIEKRYNFVTKENILLLCFDKVIYDFDKTKAYSNLNSSYLFVAPKDNGYLHLGLVSSNGCYKPETMFFNETDAYIRGQKIIKVKEVKVFDSNGNLVEDKCF